MNTPLLIIGAGNMGSAFAHAILSNTDITPHHLMISDPDPQKLLVFKEKGCMTSTDTTVFLKQAHTIILAIKPQGAIETLQQWQPYLQHHPDIISLLAGTPVKKLHEASQCAIIRIMPNLPMVVEAGLFGYYFDEHCTEETKHAYKQFFPCLAYAIECHSEDQIDAITALSGSGPAYYFLLLEYMQSKASSFGFDEENAKRIALQTLIGAGALASHSEKSFATLRENVTSKGGTTEAALKSLQNQNFESIWKQAIESAYQRAKQLSQY